MLRIANALEAQLRAAMQRAFPEQAAAAQAAGQRLDPQLAPASKPEFGDFQANGALPLAKPLGQPPRAIATAIVAQLAHDPGFAELCQEPVIAGPGFINLTLRPERLSAEVRARFDEDEAFQAASRDEVVRLQSGDPVSLKAWGLLCDQSRREFQVIYDRLDIRLQERGESFYNPYLGDVVADLDGSGLLVTDDGARCVFLEGVSGKEGKPLPVIVQKRDGGFNYATTDLAAIRYRLAAPPAGDGARRLIYVTDAGQAAHFAGVFQVARRAGWVPAEAQLEHVPFGLVQGDDGKKLKTRSGDTVRLRDLLDEAVERAQADLRRRLDDEGRHEEEAFIQHVSTTVGIAAVKYADLSTNRITNYQFSFDRMLALSGNTAPYLLYAVVRIAGIARKGGGAAEGGAAAAAQDGADAGLVFSEPQEWALIRELLKLDAVIAEVEAELLPNRLCSYLFELSQVFNRFYDQVPVLKADEPARSSRLALCRLTAATLKLGLGLLGIPTLERM